MSQTSDPTAKSCEDLKSLFYDGQHDQLMQRLDGTIINKNTLLATDYLNRYNSVLMILEILPTDPYMFIEDILSWKPISYHEHFRTSGFRERDLAILCYDHCDKHIRHVFDHVVDQLDDVVKTMIEQLELEMKNKAEENINMICNDYMLHMRGLIEQAANIINGHPDFISKTDIGDKDPAGSQKNVDAFFGKR